MDAESEVMQQQEVIQQQMEATRNSLSEKLETLEQQVAENVHEAGIVVEDSIETVQEAVGAVRETVSAVKETVQETVANVKSSVEGTASSLQETFDLSAQMEQHPWVLLGASVAVGCYLGTRKNSSRVPKSFEDEGSPTVEGRRFAPAPNPRERSWIGAALSAFRPEIQYHLQTLAAVTVGVVAGEILTECVPAQYKAQVAGAVDRVLHRLGG